MCTADLLPALIEHLTCIQMYLQHLSRSAAQVGHVYNLAGQPGMFFLFFSWAQPACLPKPSACQVRTLTARCCSALRQEGCQAQAAPVHACGVTAAAFGAGQYARRQGQEDRGREEAQAAQAEGLARGVRLCAGQAERQQAQAGVAAVTCLRLLSRADSHSLPGPSQRALF